VIDGLYGPITIARERKLRARGITLRVFWHGEDVTNRCRYVDDTPGRAVAVLYRHTPQGRCHLDEDGHVAIQIAEDGIEIHREVLEP